MGTWFWNDLPRYCEAAGWLLVSLGFLSGALLGAGFARPGFLGGYDAWKRRLLRLGHIALVALGVLNILFAMSAARIGLPAPWPGLAALGFLAGGVLMPACCVVAAFRPAGVPLFAAPVLSLTAAGTITWVGLAAGW